MRLDHTERASEKKVMIVVMVAGRHGSQSTHRERKKNSTSSNTFVLHPYFQPLQEQTCLTLGGKKRQNHTQYQCWLQLPSMANQ